MLHCAPHSSEYAPSVLLAQTITISPKNLVTRPLFSIQRSIPGFSLLPYADPVSPHTGHLLSVMALVAAPSNPGMFLMSCPSLLSPWYPMVPCGDTENLGLTAGLASAKATWAPVDGAKCLDLLTINR